MLSSGQGQGSARDGPSWRSRPGHFARRAVWPAVAVLAAVVVTLTLAAHIGQAARHTLVVASIPYWNIQHDTAAVLANRDDVTEVSPWIYGLSPSGTIEPQYPPGEASAIATDMASLRAAHLRMVPSIANVTGGAWDYPAVARDPAQPGADAPAHQRDRGAGAAAQLCRY